MTQSLAGVLISVDNKGLTESVDSNYAFQEILDATVETISYYGAKSERYSLTFILDEDRNSNTGNATLKAAVKANADVNLTMNSGSFGNFRILTYKAVLVQALNHTGLVWEVSAELVSTS
jgi:hypothetical protein